MLEIVHGAFVHVRWHPIKFMHTSPVYPFDSESYISFGSDARSPFIKIVFVSEILATIFRMRSMCALWPDARIGNAAAVYEKSYCSASRMASSENLSK